MTEKQKRNYIFAIVLLSIFLCVSLVYNFMGGFESHSQKKYALYVGQDTTLSLSGIGASVVSYAIEGTNLPNNTIMQNVTLKLPNIEPNNVTLRAKAMLGNYYLTMSGYSEWEEGEDDYYYFKGEMYQNQSIGLCTSITISDISLRTDTVYNINIIVEFIYTDGLTL